jgi:hypothetical protein
LIGLTPVDSGSVTLDGREIVAMSAANCGRRGRASR